MKPKEIWILLKKTFQKYSEDKVPRLAAALAYYTIFSIAPLLVLVIAIAGFVAGSNDVIRSQILTQVQSLTGPQTADAVDQLITRTNQQGEGVLATVVGVITLILGATGLFAQLQDTLNTIWDVEGKSTGGVLGIIKERFLSFAMVLGISFLLLVSLVINAALSVINNYFSELLGGFGLIAQISNFIISTAVITLVFALIFKVLPDIDIDWKDVWIGSLITATLFSIGKSLIGFYLGNSAAASAYGAAGSLIILLLWVYYSSQILFLGAEFTQVYARRYGSYAAAEEGLRQDVAAPDTAPPHTAASRVEEVMIPVVGQPETHTSPIQPIRYQPPNPSTVVPVVVLGAVSGVYTIWRIIRRLTDQGV